jgi:small-conductance mechanosensitive channel
MKPKRKLGVLLVLASFTVYGIVRTRTQPSAPQGSAANLAITSEQGETVDQSALATAQALAHLPTSPAELPFAQVALQLGDHEMDLAFALAVLDATQHPPVLTAEAKEIQARLQTAENALAAGQAQVAQLTAADAKASGAEKDKLDDQLDLAKAQLDLRQDEVDDAKQDLIRAGGDPEDRIEAMVQQHQAASKDSDSTKVSVSGPVDPHGLVERFQQWSALHEKQLQLWRAKQDALSAVTTLTNRHNSLEQQTDPQQKAAAGADAGQSGVPSTPVTPPNSASASRQASAAMVQSTKRRAADSKTLSTLDQRIDNENQLATVYGQWAGVVATEQRTLVNRALYGVVIILGIAIIGLFVDDWITSLLGKSSMDRRQEETLRTVVRGTLQVIGLFLLLLVIFGPPGQLGTFLGLLGAGLTVALQSFILGFIGRFVLMGKNGIRIGDWVEIEGVTGEVVELGPFHTVLLETGNWTDLSHPTGRRVTFTNGFAIAGHYFNFSTSGQWLWDELQIVLPAGQNPYPIVDALQKKVLEVTSDSAHQAELEWKGAAQLRDMKTLSTTPFISVKPVAGGTEIRVRYITHASERSEMRAKLYHAAVDLLGPGLAPQPASDSPQPALPPTK